jgi:hypothetical protein
MHGVREHELVVGVAKREGSGARGDGGWRAGWCTGASCGRQGEGRGGHGAVGCWPGAGTGYGGWKIRASVRDGVVAAVAAAAVAAGEARKLLRWLVRGCWLVAQGAWVGSVERRFVQRDSRWLLSLSG